MPEGDSIHRAARTMQTALAGRTVTRFETVLPALARIDEDQPLRGRTIDRVIASGKNLIIEFSGDLHLRTHMRMHGSWHLYKPGERWRKRRSDMRIVIDTAEWIAVGFNIPIAEFHDSRSLARQDDLRLIGPDALGEEFDLDEAKRRVRARPDEEIANVLLNQRVVSGIGNEYKSEILFLGGVNPFAKASDLSDETIESLLKNARRLMRANVGQRFVSRATTGSLNPEDRLWVYSRGGDPCRKCGTTIEYRKQGRDARGTYWCPRCQPESTATERKS